MFALALTLTSIANTEVFHCKGKDGKTKFQDSECSSDETLIKKTASVKVHNVINFDNSGIELDPSLKTIFKGKKIGSQTRFVNIAIVDETDEYLLLEVVGYFSGSPRGKMQFRAVPNIKWSYSGEVHATDRGYVKAHTRISLNSSAKETEASDIFSLQLWHYSPENKATRVSMITVPFKKVWHKKSD